MIPATKIILGFRDKNGVIFGTASKPSEIDMSLLTWRLGCVVVADGRAGRLVFLLGSGAVVRDGGHDNVRLPYVRFK